MLLIMLSAMQGWSAGTYNQRVDHTRKQISSGASQFKSLTWEADPRKDATIGSRTYKVPSSKNPVKVQVLVGPDKSLGAFALATV
jgi:hypothetical protein